MNLEDYFDMLNKMAKKNSQTPSSNHGVITNHHQDDDASEEEEEPLPIEKKAKPD